MLSYTEVTEIVADQVTDAFRFLDEAGSTVVAGLEDSATRLLSTVPGLPEGSKAPSLDEVVAANFAAAERVVQARQKLAVDLLNAARPKTK